MQGRHVADNTDARQAKPGDYWWNDWTGKRELWFRDPHGDAGRVTTHTVEEHDDGTVSVAPSIAPKPGEDGYHGLLTQGVWSDG